MKIRQTSEDIFFRMISKTIDFHNWTTAGWKDTPSRKLFLWLILYSFFTFLKLLNKLVQLKIFWRRTTYSSHHILSHKGSSFPYFQVIKPLNNSDFLTWCNVKDFISSQILKQMKSLTLHLVKLKYFSNLSG